nr:hypothetical protein [Vibrio mexicanus]
MLLFCKNKSLRLLAIASIPIGIMNVNEILLFGLPIILNPRMFLSFLLAPMANVAIAYAALSLGIMGSPWVSVPFNSPILINAWIATGET